MNTEAAIAEEKDDKTGFIRARGMDYVEYLAALHTRFLFDWYLEIGCRNGRSFAPVRGKTVAVDPFFKVRHNVIGQKPALFVFQQTSDDFFASNFLSRHGIKLGFSFLDGMHLFEFLLRDFINTEANSDPKGVIAMHDCCPFSHGMTIRDHTQVPPRSAWTGDVWKLLPILQEYRPDLKITVIDASPTGVVLVSGLNPQNTVLSDAYDSIVARYADITLKSYGAAKLYDSFKYSEAARITGTDKTPFSAVAINKSAALLPKQVSL